MHDESNIQERPVMLVKGYWEAQELNDTGT